MIRAKQNASYWLGLIAQDTRQFDVAINYLQRRTLEASPDGPWTHGARYNLARTYEAVGAADGDHGKLERARQLYLSGNGTPQRHGNLLRARRLDDLLTEGTKASAPRPPH